MNRDERVEMVAEALWREDFRRGAGRERITPWAEAGDHPHMQWRSLARAALAIIEPAVREAIAAWHDEQAEGENALSVLAERDGDCGGERLHHHLANEHDASAAAIRAGAKP